MNWTHELGLKYINSVNILLLYDPFFRLEKAYGSNMMNIDLYVGGMLESYGGPGPLFTKIIK